MSATGRWLGIDFSGDAASWRVRCSRSNVWIASIVEEAGDLRLDQLCRVQALPGAAAPFGRLASALAVGDFDVAAIDAPFSLPGSVTRARSHRALLTVVSSLRRAESRPFGQAFDLAREFVPGLPRGRKIYRETEYRWRKRGLNVRSTTWAGPRGGAAMTVACMTLLQASGAPLWPWRRERRGLVAEAFPAAQLHQWGLPHQRYAYGDPTSVANRRSILRQVRSRLAISSDQCQWLASSADALDAVLCAFAARAVSLGCLESEPGAQARLEGWIAVHG